MYSKYVVVSQDDAGRPKYELRKIDIRSDVKDKNWEEGDKLVTYQFVQQRMNKLLGQVLTIIDASIGEKIQNKAVKDIIKNTFIDEYVELTDMLYDKKGLREAEENASDKEITEVSTDEALGLKK